MEHVVDIEDVDALLRSISTWLREDVIVWSTAAQIFLIVAALAAAIITAPRLQRWIGTLPGQRRFERWTRGLTGALSSLMLPITWLLLQWFAVIVASRAAWPHELIDVTVSLLTAWVIIRFTSSFVRNPAWSRLIALTAWSLAALNILGLLEPTAEFLDSVALTFGQLRLSALTVIQGLIVLAALLWIAASVSRILEHRIESLPSLTPSLQLLFSKLLKLVLLCTAVVAALATIGIDLTAFAVFSGAIGLGIGFGLQKAVSNLIGGVSLLLDKSIKPGDVISIGDTYGWITSLNSRYVAVSTFDGIEHLIPNETLLGETVRNWTYTNNLVRVKAPIGISYDSDVHKAIRICLEAAAATPRIVREPKSLCLLKGFGQSSLDLELQFWIADPKNGLSNVRSDVLLRILDKFQEHAIEIPFPQVDLHLRTGELSVPTRPGSTTARVPPGPGSPALATP